MAIIVVCSILGFFAIVTIVLLLRTKYCPFWSPKEAISDCTSDWKCCRTGEKNERKMHVSAVSPTIQLREKEKRKSNWAPIKRHMSDLKIVMQTPKPGTCMIILSKYNYKICVYFSGVLALLNLILRVQ